MLIKPSSSYEEAVISTYCYCLPIVISAITNSNSCLAVNHLNQLSVVALQKRTKKFWKVEIFYLNFFFLILNFDLKKKISKLISLKASLIISK